MTRPVTLLARETRSAVPADRLDLEIRFDTPGEDGTFEGYAVRFGVTDSYRTSFAPDAFVVEGRSLPLLWSHDPSQVVGSVRQISADPSGLKIIGKLNLDVQRAREARSMLLAGDVRGLSIGFRRLADQPGPNGTRRIIKAELAEVSLVAIPSVPGSVVTSIRAAADLSTFTRAVKGATAALRRG